MQRGFTESEMKEAGLLAQSEEGGATYDKFRGRLMFPIYDGSGRVIAFGGRLIDPEAKGPKYLNSPETPLFRKSHQLYHLDVARRAASKTRAMLVVEGYMDVIALAQAGFDHAVAPLGTAITKDQLALLWQVVDEPILCLDGDAAGWRAMERALELALPLLAPAKSLAFVRLPAGEDPDSLVQKQGAEAMERLLIQRQPLIEVFWEKFYTTQPHETPEQQAGVEETLKRMIEQIQNASVRMYYQQAVKERLWNARRQNFSKNSKKNVSHKKDAASGMPDGSLQVLRRSKAALLTPMQEHAGGRTDTYLAMLLLFAHYPALWDGAWEEALAEAHLTQPVHQQMRDLLLEILSPQEGVNRETVIAAIMQANGMKAWKAFLRETSRHLPKSVLSATEDVGMQAAQIQLQYLSQRLELMALEDAYSEAHMRFAQTMQDREWQRMEHLRQRISEVKHTQSFFPED